MKISAPKFLQEHLLPAAAFFAVALGLMQIGYFQDLDNKTQDGFTRLRAKQRPSKATDQLAVIGIGEESLRKFGRWPWGRNLHGDFLQLAGAAGAGVVTWDILFTEPAKSAKMQNDEAEAMQAAALNALVAQGEKFSELDAKGREAIKTALSGVLADLAGDDHLVEGIKAATGAEVAVIFGGLATDPKDGGIRPDSETARASALKALPKVEGDRTHILSYPTMLLAAGEMARAADVGFVNTPPGPDGIRRWVPLVVRVGDEVYPTLSLQSLIKHWRAKPEQVTVRLGEAITIETANGPRHIPINASGALLVNYRLLADGFHTYDYSKVFEALYHRYAEGADISPPPLEGRILLVGQIADALSDMGPTPLKEITPLVLVHANVIENILKGDYARLAPLPLVWLGAFALGLTGLMFFSKRKLRDHAIYSLGLPAAYVGAAYLAWAQWSLWLPLVGPVVGFVSLQVFAVGRRVIAEQKAKQEIKGMFGTYVSPALVSRMIDSGTPPQLGGHDDEITAYFSDIQSFSSFSEKLKSGPLVELMNEYLTACTDIVQAQGGAVDKYIGDAVVAMFGAPVPLPDHAFRACVTTQLVHAKLAELRAKWKAEGDKWPQIVWNMQTRIGLNSGVCMIGNMGSRSRFNYTMMGDNVNLAARMESGSKQYGAYTMCAEATKLACEKHGGDRVVFRFMDKIVVKGRSIPVPIYEITGLKEHLAPTTHDCLGLFAEGIARYLVQDWAGAEALFRRSAELEPNQPGKTPGVESNPSLALLARCAYMRAHPPGADWDGVFHMKEK
jgi:adenylate cyclase